MSVHTQATATRVEKAVGSIVRVAVTAVYLELVWLLACLPVVTAPAATVSLLRVVAVWMRTGERPTARGLARVARAQLGPATVLGGGLLLVAVVLAGDLYAIGRMGADRRIWLVAWLFVAVVAAVLLLFVPAALADGVTSVRGALSTAARVALAHPLRAAAGVACVVVATALTVALPVLGLVTGVATAAAVESLWRRAAPTAGEGR